MTDDGGRLRSLARLLDRRWGIGLIAGAAACVVVGSRIAVAGKGNPGQLILLGRSSTTRGYHYLIPVHTSGYDGQYYYRFALGPFHFARTWAGITLDTFGRFNRISYSVLGWIAAAGRPSAVPWSLLAVNVVAIAALGWLGASLARSAGHHALWGLVLPAYGGFLWSLGRDLTEIVESAFLVAGLLALRRGRPVWAGILLIGAVLGRETAMGLVGALLVGDLVGRIQPLQSWLRRHGQIVEDGTVTLTAAWLIPLLAFVGWQLAVRAETGTFPLSASGQANLGPPLVGFVHALRRYTALFPHHASLTWFASLFVLVVVVVLAGTTLARSAAPVYERLAWSVYVLLGVCLSKGIWLGDVGFRSLDDLYVMSIVLLLTSARLTVSRPIRLLPILSTAAWVLTAAQVVRDL